MASDPIESLADEFYYLELERRQRVAHVRAELEKSVLTGAYNGHHNRRAILGLDGPNRHRRTSSATLSLFPDEQRSFKF